MSPGVIIRIWRVDDDAPALPLLAEIGIPA